MKVLLSNLHPQIKEKELVELLEEFGKCQSVKVFRLKEKEYIEVSAVVEICQEDGEIITKFLNGDIVMGKPLHVSSLAEPVHTT